MGHKWNPEGMNYNEFYCERCNHQFGYQAPYESGILEKIQMYYWFRLGNIKCKLKKIWWKIKYKSGFDNVPF